MISMFQVLIVEDSRLFRHVFKEMIRTRFPSFDIYEASNGEEALRIIDHTPPNLIFMDIRLPEANGLDLIRKIKARHPKIISIVLTGYDREYRDVALECADYFLSKRSTCEDVFALIEDIHLRNKAEQADPASLG